jgi:hypothetical protein
MGDSGSAVARELVSLLISNCFSVQDLIDFFARWREKFFGFAHIRKWKQGGNDNLANTKRSSFRQAVWPRRRGSHIHPAVEPLATVMLFSLAFDKSALSVFDLSISLSITHPHTRTPHVPALSTTNYGYTMSNR